VRFAVGCDEGCTLRNTEGRCVEDANYSDESEGKTDFQGEIL